MAWMDHKLQISLERYALLMEDKMATGALGALRIMGETALLLIFAHIVSFAFQL